MREKPKIRMVSWIFDFYYGGKCVQCRRLESKSSVNRFWYVVNSSKCNKLSNLFNCLVLSYHKLRSDLLLKFVQRFTGVDIIVMDLVFSVGL